MAKLEDLNKQIKEKTKSANALKEQIEHFEQTPIDPVLNHWLERQFSFNYTLEKSYLDNKMVLLKEAIAKLNVELKKLSVEAEEEAFQQKLRDTQIHFEGLDVEGSVGSVAKIKCSHCGYRFQTDLRSHGSFGNVYKCSTDIALSQMYAMKYNVVWPFQCEKCHGELDVWVKRAKI